MTECLGWSGMSIDSIVNAYDFTRSDAAVGLTGKHGLLLVTILTLGTEHLLLSLVELEDDAVPLH
ncbi:hypothetical protein [Mycobacterium uberis]|uniref:hypothetical protein n=1 Tax=Mycobacterium uberis TaxID=2162698 RepID=UPI001058E86C|nr:hypothetical protein [Mycobacterium uberis]